MHHIRLAEPWQKTTMPQGILWRRGFGRPGHLSPGERVWLVGTDLLADGWLSINGGAAYHITANAFRLEITALLAPRNELCLELVSAGEDSATSPGDIRLEITPQ